MNSEARDRVLREVGPLEPAVREAGQAFFDIAIARDLSHREAMSTVAIVLATLVSVEDDEALREKHMLMMDVLMRVMVGKLVDPDPPP